MTADQRSDYAFRSSHFSLLPLSSAKAIRQAFDHPGDIGAEIVLDIMQAHGPVMIFNAS